MVSFPETYCDPKFSSLISILFPKKISGENLTKKNQSIFSLVVILVILITLSYDDELKLLGGY